MNNLQKAKYLKVGLYITKKVGQYLLKNFGPVKGFTHKSEYHYGIHEDIESNKLYENFLSDKTPEVGLFTEEGQQDLSKEMIWVVDPIEGTSNYRVGNPFWATQICLLENKEPVVSVVYAPTLKLVFTAVKGGGAFKNGKKISVSGLRSLKLALIDMDKGHAYADLKWFADTVFKVLKHVRTFRHFGACGLELALTASGSEDIFLNKGSRLYDFAPGVLLVREAGGVALNLSGKEWSYKDAELMCTNRKLASQLLNVI